MCQIRSESLLLPYQRPNGIQDECKYWAQHKSKEIMFDHIWCAAASPAEGSNIYGSNETKI